MNRYNDWENSLRITNEDLEGTGYSLLITQPEEEGFYNCEIWKDGELYDVYAENYYEDELDALVVDARHHIYKYILAR